MHTMHTLKLANCMCIIVLYVVKLHVALCSNNNVTSVQKLQMLAWPHSHFSVGAHHTDLAKNAARCRNGEVRIQHALKLANVDLGCLNVMASSSLFLHFSASWFFHAAIWSGAPSLHLYWFWWKTFLLPCFLTFYGVQAAHMQLIEFNQSATTLMASTFTEICSVGPGHHICITIINCPPTHAWKITLNSIWPVANHLYWGWYHVR